MDDIFYVYGYIDPRTGEYIYVGKGQHLRAYVHLKKCKNRILKAKIRAIRTAGMEPNVVFFACDISEELAFELEKKFISEYGRIDLGTGTLCNGTDGGEGSSGSVFSEETRRKLSEAQRGKTHSEDTRRKIGEGQRGKNVSDETRRKLSEAARNMSEETRRKIADTHIGKKRSADARRKMSEAKRNISEETRRKMSEAKRNMSEETRRKMSEAKKNAPKKECPHCHGLFAPGMFTRWHGDKCKMKP